MAPSSVPWQGPWDNDTEDCGSSASLHRTMSWVASTREFVPYAVDYQDPQTMVSIDQTTGPAPPPPEPTPSICDNLSELSDVSDGSAVRQTITLEALPNIGRSFLAAYNRIDMWASILSLRTPQPLQTIKTIQSIGKQARTVLVSLFSIGCLPSKHWQDSQLAGGGCHTDELCTTVEQAGAEGSSSSTSPK